MIRKIVLFTTLIVILLSTKVNASEVPVNNVTSTIVEHSVAMGVDPAMALSIAKVESGYNHSKRSRYGAIGVFQLMPATAKRLGVNPYQMSDNIKGGISYYKMMYKMFGSTELALAAYNAGPSYILKHKHAPSYTRGYVARIMSEYKKMKAMPTLAAKSPVIPSKPVAPQQSVKITPVTITSHGSVKPMTASSPRVINDGTNRLIIKQKADDKTTKNLQVTMNDSESVS